MPYRSLVTLLFVATLVPGCKKTYRDIGHEPEMKQRIDSFLEEMAAISDSFPKELSPLPQQLDPPLRYHDSVNCNAFIAETLQLSRLDSDVGFANKDYFKLMTTRKIRHTLEDRHDGQKEAPEDYKEQLETILGLQYVVAAFVIYRKPEIIDNETYTGGTARALIAVYDRKSKSWLGGFECHAKPQSTVEFKTSDKAFVERDGTFALKTSTLSHLMKEIHAGLSNIEDPQSLEEPAEAPEAEPTQ